MGRQLFTTAICIFIPVKHWGETELAMVVPVRCFSCGKVIGDRWQEFIQRVRNGEAAGDVLESLNINRYCCRRMMLSHVQMSDDLLKIYAKERIPVREE